MSAVSSWVSSVRRSLPRFVCASLAVAVYLLSYLLLDTVSLIFNVGSGISVWYLPAALTFVLLFAFGLKHLPVVFAAVLLVQLVNDPSHPFFSSLLNALTYPLIYGGAVLILRRLQIDPHLRHLRDVAWLMLFGGFLAPLAAGLLTMTNFALFGLISGSEWFTLLLQYAAGDATGVGALAPFCLVMLRYAPWVSETSGVQKAIWRWPDVQEAWRILLFAGLLALTAFVAYALPQTLTLDHSYVTFIPVLLIAGWYGFGWATATTLFINICTALFTFPEFGRVNGFALQFGLLTLTHLGILLGALVTERKRATERLQHIAFHDVLTGLPNRAHFLERLERAADGAKGVRVAVLFIDLDRFKEINDGLGHDAGDAALVEAARRLEHCLRPGDTVARFGGDEFTVLLAAATPYSALSVAERIQQAFAAPFSLEQTVPLGTSIGVALSSPEETQPEALLRNADTALRRAKSLGRRSSVIFDAGMSTDQLEQARVERELERALERQELVVYYQPIVALETQKIVGVEALLRWQQPERGLVLPSVFIPVAERTGLVIALGNWMMEQALAQLSRWREAGHTELFVSVNVSARQVQHPQLLGNIRETLGRFGLPPSCVALEFTESVLIEETDENTAHLKTLYDAGLGLSLDDFGTGYSSLGYLKRLPVHTLKIDRSFLTGVPENESDTVIIKAILAIAQTMKLGVIAEGVETPAQANFLRAHGCTQAQGYLFGRPVPADTLTSLLQA